jgi:hypothetical protein
MAECVLVVTCSVTTGLQMITGNMLLFLFADGLLEHGPSKELAAFGGIRFKCKHAVISVFS